MAKRFKRLTSDLTARFGRGFSDRSLYKMRLFYLSHPEISPAVSAKFEPEISPTVSAKSVGQNGVGFDRHRLSNRDREGADAVCGIAP